MTRAASQIVAVCLLGTVGMFVSGQALAARFHVSPDGTRTVGASVPDDWSDANCYPSILAGSNAAGVADSLLLNDGTHDLGDVAMVPRFLGNRRLDANAGATTISVAGNGRCVVDGAASQVEIRGLTWAGDGNASDYAAIEITNPDSGLVAVSISDCAFSSLEGSDRFSPLAGGGSAIRADGNGGGAFLEIRDCRFIGNRSRGGGGAVFIGQNYNAYVSDSVFRGNLSDNGRQLFDGRGGAIFVRSNDVRSDLAMVDCVVDSNSARGPGGALFVEEASVALYGVEISNSQSGLGGVTAWSAGAGVFVRGMATHTQPLRFDMWNCRVAGNRGDIQADPAAGDGGGVLVKGISGQMVDVRIAEVVFEDNFNAQGAGLYVGRFTTGEVERCTFRNNIAYFFGGGSYKGGAFAENLGETIVYNYCEFIGNKAGFDADGTEAEVRSRGAGFCTRLNPRAFFYNCTFLQNRVNSFDGLSDAIFMWQDGGIVDTDLKRMRLFNCLFYGTNAQDIQINTLDNTFSIVSNCAFEDGEFSSSGVTPTGTVILTSIPCVDTTNAELIPGSACIDAGLEVGLLEDLAGHEVPSGDAPDIGAREYVPDSAPAAVSDDMLQASLHSAQVAPNPFNPRTRIMFSLDASDEVEVRIFDVRGALVREVFRGHRAPGRHTVSWDGRDENGRAVASGAYLALIRNSTSHVTRSLMLVR